MSNKLIVVFYSFLTAYRGYLARKRVQQMREKGYGQETAVIFFLQQVSKILFISLSCSIVDTPYSSTISTCLILFGFGLFCSFCCLVRLFALICFPLFFVLFFSLFEFSLDHKIRSWRQNSSVLYHGFEKYGRSYKAVFFYYFHKQYSIIQAPSALHLHQEFETVYMFLL